MAPPDRFSDALQRVLDCDTHRDWDTSSDCGDTVDLDLKDVVASAARVVGAVRLQQGDDSTAAAAHESNALPHSNRHERQSHALLEQLGTLTGSCRWLPLQSSSEGLLNALQELDKAPASTRLHMQVGVHIVPAGRAHDPTQVRAQFFAFLHRLGAPAAHAALSGWKHLFQHCPLLQKYVQRIAYHHVAQDSELLFIVPSIMPAEALPKEAVWVESHASKLPVAVVWGAEQDGVGAAKAHAEGLAATRALVLAVRPLGPGGAFVEVQLFYSPERLALLGTDSQLTSDESGRALGPLLDGAVLQSTALAPLLRSTVLCARRRAEGDGCWGQSGDALMRRQLIARIGDTFTAGQSAAVVHADLAWG